MKTTSLPSVEKEIVQAVVGEWPEHSIMTGRERNNLFDAIKPILTQDRNQAYTRLVEGIEGMKTDERKVATFGEWQAESYEDKMLVNAILTDILKNVVNPLYGKE